MAIAATWARTITIEAENQSCTHIKGTRDAAHYLLDRWVKSKSRLYCDAVRVCAKAIKGEISHEAAYLSFMAAVREANLILISNRSFGSTDDLENNIEMIVAEGILADLKAYLIK